MRLLVAAQAGCLDLVDVNAALKGLLRTQIRDEGHNRGRFLWYLEEKSPADDHAIFFNGMSLSALWSVGRDELGDEAQDLLADLLREMRFYAMRRVRARGIHYPNEFLGYVLCAWFPSELLGIGDDRDELVEVMGQAADFWMEHGWGWGEHLSDIYSNILHDELSLLLLLSKELPEELRKKLVELLRELLTIEDQFRGGPRVPAIRSYAFLESPTYRSYRDHIRPLPEDATFRKSRSSGSRLDTCNAPYETESGGTWLPLAHALHALGWHEMAASLLVVPPSPARAVPRAGCPDGEVGAVARTEAPPVFGPGAQTRREGGTTSDAFRDIEIRCFQGARAVAHVRENVRLGSLSRFPLMPTAEHATWGLSWQCFPVALWRPGSWGYFQWEALEDGGLRSHPARTKHWSYLRNALTGKTRPPVVGWTYSIQRGGDLMVLRVMRAIIDAWEELTDRFRLVGATGGVESERGSDDWSQLILTYPERQVAVNCLTLCAPAPAELLHNDEGVLDWGVRASGEALRGYRGLVTLWGISLDGPVRESPRLEPDPDSVPMPRSGSEKAWTLCWNWPHTRWRLRIDTTDTQPIRFID